MTRGSRWSLAHRAAFMASVDRETAAEMEEPREVADNTAGHGGPVGRAGQIGRYLRVPTGDWLADLVRDWERPGGCVVIRHGRRLSLYCGGYA